MNEKIINGLDICDHDWSLMEDVFYETSMLDKNSTQKQKENLKHKYFEYYKKYYLEYFTLYKSSIGVGYICAAPNTTEDEYFLKN